MLSLVTGATGLLGNNLVRLLLSRGERVRVLVRDGFDPRTLAGLEVELARGDVRDAASVGAAVSGVERVYNSAGLVHIGRRRLEALRAVNATGAATVARVCRAAGVRMVQVSSVDALGFGTREDPADERRLPRDDLRVPYVLTKRAGDELVTRELEAGLDVVFVHPAYLLGPWDWKPSSGRMLLEVARGKAVAAPPGGNDFCHVEDVAQGVRAAGERAERGEHFILGGDALTYREAFDLFARVTGAVRPLLTAPGPLVLLAGLAGDLVGLLSGREPDVNSASALMSTLPHHFADRKARERLGYANRGAEAAAKDAWEWFLEHGYAPSSRAEAR
jgi:dihydroflavonol-4-reductase